MRSDRANPKLQLLHMRENILLARRFVEGVDYEGFRDDTLIFYAVMRALEIVSEASRRLPPDMKARRPEIPWRDLAGAGSVYRHDYEDVRQRDVWNTIHKFLPPLLLVVEAELRGLGELL